ncbi:MAG TPA: serine/threonine-protein kinase [Pirellulales bacterium]|nr:serine/threonine-protein kinase [Pirellulales bacterium]
MVGVLDADGRIDAMTIERDAQLFDSAARHDQRTLPPIDLPNAPTPPQKRIVDRLAETIGRDVVEEAVSRKRDFGDYELLAEIARGGMGVVYKARQKRLNRTVAVKMIIAGQLADQDEVRRFLTEAEAAAGLDHPGIVPVYESGEIDGQHFFSMGFVEGQSLAALLADGPLPPPHAAELLAHVADAVDYAHERGVIHRDLKPGNILLDLASHPRVTDFGLAKRVTGDSSLTRSGQTLGTPSYMPPEQASGKLDAIGRAADIYALGAVLYATLTGRPPFQAATPLDTILQLLEQEPVTPRRLNTGVPRDLETIALKCLEKEPHKRYATARQLSDELRRFLSGEPIEARPIGQLERGWRWCRRNPATTSLAAAACIALLAGTAFSTYFAIKANQRAGEAENSAELALQAQRSEAKQLRRTRAALTAETLAKQAESRARGAETTAKNEARAAIDRFVDAVNEAELLKDVRFQPLRKKLLSDALAYYQSFIDSHEHDASQRRELADALRRVGFISAHTGSTDDARAAFTRAAEMFDVLVAERSDVVEYANDLAKTCNDLGLLFSAAGDQSAARTYYQRAIEAEEKLVAQNPSVAEYRIDLAKHCANLGNLQHRLGEHKAANAGYRRAIEIAEKLVEENPSIGEYRSVLAKTLDNLAMLERRGGDLDAARGLQERAMTIEAELVAAFPTVAEYRSDFAKDYQNLGDGQLNANDLGAAAASYQHAVDLLERLVVEHPTVAEYRDDLATNYGNLALVRRASGEQAAALSSFQRAIEIYESVPSETENDANARTRLAWTYHELGLLQVSSGDGVAAQTSYQRAMEIREKLVAENPADISLRINLAGSCCNLANAIRDQGQAADSLAPFARGAEVIERVLGEKPENPTARLFLRNICFGRALALDTLDRHAEAADGWRRAAELDSGDARAYFRLKFSEALARAGEHVRAANEAAALAAAKDPATDTIFRLASVFSLCVRAADDDATAANQYGERAVELLTRLRAAGFFSQAANIDELRRNRAFDSVRDRDDFRQFDAQLGARGP